VELVLKPLLEPPQPQVLLQQAQLKSSLKLMFLQKFHQLKFNLE
jgi:hypothetical protein